MKPLAPFGEMVPFSVATDVSTTPSLPADPRLGTPEMKHQAAVLSDLRRAVRLFNEGKIEESDAIWNHFAEDNEPLLQPHRLTWARARVRWTLGQLKEADTLLAGLDTDAAPFDVRAHAFIARALIADRIASRDAAIGLYRQAQAYLDAHPDYYDQITVIPLRARIAAGLKATHPKGPMPATPDLQMAR